MPRLRPSSFKRNRVFNGRLIPANRFNLKPGSLRAVFANATPKTAPNVRGVAASGARFTVSEFKHPVLSSIQLSALDAEADNKGGPLLQKTKSMILPDRANINLSWVKQAYEIVVAKEQMVPVFRARNLGVGIDGRDIWMADITFEIRQTRPKATQRQIEQMQQKRPNLKFRDIATTLREAVLKLPYESTQGQRNMAIKGALSQDGRFVSFSLTGEAVLLAWRLLSKSSTARLDLLSEYTAYDPVGRKNPAKAKTAGGRTGDKSKPNIVSLTNISSWAKRQINNKARSHRFGRKPKTSHQNLSAGIVHDPVALRKLLMAARETKTNILTQPAPEDGQGMYTKQRMVVSQSHSLIYPHAENMRHFVMVNPATNQETPIIQPPWLRDSGPVQELRRVAVGELNLPMDIGDKVTVYASLVEAGYYLVIPETYVISREIDSGRVQFYADVITQPENPENSAVQVSLGLEPELLPYQHILLRAALGKHLENLTPAGQTPPKLKVGFPTDLGTLPNLTWGDSLSQAATPVIDGTTILLTLTTQSLGFAKAMFDTITTKNRALFGQLRFTLPDGEQIGVSIIVGLTRTTGQSIDIQSHTDGRTLTFTELAGFEHIISGAVSLGRLGQVVQPTFAPSVGLQANATHEKTLEIGEATDTGWSAKAEIQFPDVIDIDPNRISVGEMLTPIIVTSSLLRGAEFTLPAGGGPRGLQSIGLHVSIEGHDTFAITMQADPDEGYFAPQVINLAVPLTRVLSPSGRLLQFRATLGFDDGSTLATNWMSKNYGLNPDINIVRDLFE